MQVKIKYLHPDAKTPTYATDGSACFDLYAATTYVNEDWTHEFDTGLAFDFPEGHVMLVYSRSGFGFRDGAKLVNAVAVIDQDFKGSVRIKYDHPIPAGVGDRIAQAMILPVSQVQFYVVEQLSDTARGAGGFGSTGIK